MYALSVLFKNQQAFLLHDLLGALYSQIRYGGVHVTLSLEQTQLRDGKGARAKGWVEDGVHYYMFHLISPRTRTLKKRSHSHSGSSNWRPLTLSLYYPRDIKIVVDIR